jgi:hypothetical protein
MSDYWQRRAAEQHVKLSSGIFSGEMAGFESVEPASANYEKMKDGSLYTICHHNTAYVYYKNAGTNK